MPGISVVTNPPGIETVSDALQSVCLRDEYGYTLEYSSDSVVLGHSGYEQYPIRVFEFDDYTAVLEGHIYDARELEKTVSSVTHWIETGNLDRLGEWAATTDGEFLLVILGADGSVWAVNDPLGRLPTYRATIGETTVMSRELGVVRSLAREMDGDLRPDHLGIGQVLLFGYPLGTRTLFADVAQLPPASCVDLTAGTTQSLFELRFDIHRTDLDFEAHVDRLCDRFISACKNRASVVDTSLVSLSGGLDSRAVIAGYSHVDCPLGAVTSARRDGGNAAEVEVASHVAEALDVPWRSYEADWRDEHERFLLRATQGMNTLGMSIGVDFVDQVSAQEPGRTMLLTGDGGDKALPDLRPRGHLKTPEDLLESILANNHVFPVEEVSRMLPIDRERILDSVRERLDEYPETTLDAKYVHFLVRERGINWLNHGEDRTRYFLWSSSPFYALPFFSAAMACPPVHKRRTTLYRAFLARLSPEAVSIDYVDFGAPIDSIEYRLKRYAYDWLSQHPGITAQLSRLHRDADASHTAEAAAKLEALGGVNAGTDSVIPESELDELVDNHTQFSRKQLFIVYTVRAALADQVASDRTAVAQFG